MMFLVLCELSTFRFLINNNVLFVNVKFILLVSSSFDKSLNMNDSELMRGGVTTGVTPLSGMSGVENH